jgi:sugar-specific transcriptional regulator TrmB
MMDVTAGLRQLGMSDYEARAYAALVAQPGGTGYEIAKRAGIPRAKIYETLAALVNRGVVTTSQEEKRLHYHPLNPDTLLRRHREQAETLTRDLAPRLRQLATGEESSPLLTIRGYDRVVRRAQDVLAASGQRAFVAGWPVEIETLAPDLARAEARGVRVYTLVYGEVAVALPRLYQHHPLGPHEGERPWPPLAGSLPWLVVVGDHAEALIAQTAPSDQTVALWTRQPAVVLVAAEYIKHDIFFVEADRLLAERGISLNRELLPLQGMWFAGDWERRP